MSDKLPPLEEFEKLPLYELVPLLDPIVEPDPVSWLPATPVWGLALTVLFFAALLVVVKRLKQQRANAYRKLGIEELEKLPADLDSINWLFKLMQILFQPCS